MAVFVHKKKQQYIRPEDHRAVIIRNIPEDVRAAFKAKCALHGVSMQGVILELIKNFIKQ